MEAFGDALVVEPYLATMMTAQLVARGGTPAQKEAILSEVATGKLMNCARSKLNPSANGLLTAAATAFTHRSGAGRPLAMVPTECQKGRVSGPLQGRAGGAP